MKADKYRITALVLLSAILVGLIYIYPDAKFISSLKDGYKGIAMTATNDELRYLAQINAFYKGGNPTLSGFDNYEHRGEPWTFGFLPPLLMGWLGRLLDISVTQLDLLMSFILPAFLFILVYILTFKMSDSRVLGILGAFSVLFGYHLFSGKISILNQVLTLKYAESLWFLRPVSPQLNHIFLLLSLIMIFVGLGEKRRWAVWSAGVMTGLLFYVFFYYWTFIYAGLSVLFLIALVKKDRGLARGVSIIFFVSLLISIPYWANLLQLIHSKNYADLEYFHNILHTRRPLFPLSQAILTIFIFVTFYKKSNDFRFFYIAAFLIGGVICVNQHVITGKVMFPGHWIGYSNKTFLIVSLFASLRNFKYNKLFIKLNKNGFISRYVTACFIVLFTFLAVFQQSAYLSKNSPFYRAKQSLSGALDWLRKNTSKDDVVATDPLNNMRAVFPEAEDVLAYSHNFNFIPVSAGTLRSREEVEDRYFIIMALLGYSPDQAREFYTFNNGAYLICMNAMKEYGGKGMPAGYLDHLNMKYPDFLDYATLAFAAGVYRLDYVLVSNKFLYKPYFKLADTSKVYEDDEFVIYKLSDRIIKHGA